MLPMPPPLRALRGALLLAAPLAVLPVCSGPAAAALLPEAYVRLQERADLHADVTVTAVRIAAAGVCTVSGTIVAIRQDRGGAARLGAPLSFVTPCTGKALPRRAASERPPYAADTEALKRADTVEAYFSKPDRSGRRTLADHGHGLRIIPRAPDQDLGG